MFSFCQISENETTVSYDLMWYQALSPLPYLSPQRGRKESWITRLTEKYSFRQIIIYLINFFTYQSVQCVFI